MANFSSVVKFDIVKFEERINFSLWKKKISTWTMRGGGTRYESFEYNLYVFS